MRPTITRWGILVIAVLLTPFLLDVMLGVLSLEDRKLSDVIRTLIYFVCHVTIVSFFGVIFVRLIEGFNMAFASVYTAGTLLTTRINHLAFEQSTEYGVHEALTLLFACLLVFTLIFLQKRLRWKKSQAMEESK